MKIFLIVLTIFISSMSFAQIIEGTDGLFYNDKNELYTGNYAEYYANGQVKGEMSIKQGM